MAKLAVNGGMAVRTKKWSKWPVCGQKEVDLLAEVVESGNWGWNGPKELKFAAEFARLHDAQYGMCAVNGTATLEIALRACGIGMGDEVIVPALTWVGTATAALLVNAVPVFVDVNPRTYCIDPERIEAAVNVRTKAIIPVHLFASVADMDAIMDIAKRHNLFVIEDCAHSHGSRWRDKGVGSVGHIGSFSFQKSKVMTCGEGGIILSNSSELIEKCYSLKDCGRTRKEAGLPGSDSINMLGWNYRMTEFQAAVLLAQLEQFPGQLKTKGSNFQYLTEQLTGIDGITPITTLNDSRVTRQSFYRYIIEYDASHFAGKPVELFRKALAAEGIPCGCTYEPVYKSNLFVIDDKYCPNPVQLTKQYGRTECPAAEKASKIAVAFNHEMFLSLRDDMDDIVEAIVKIKKYADELKD